MSDQNENPSPETSATPAPVPVEPAKEATLSLTQSDLNRMIGEARTKARSAAESTFTNQLSDLGFAGGLSELKAAREAEQRAIQDALIANGEYKDLFEAEKAARLAQEGKVAQLVESQQQTQLQNTLLSAARNTVNPEHVAQLLSSKMQRDEAGNLYSETATGQRIGVEETMKSFLAVNPYLLKPAAGRGASNAGANSVPSVPTDDEAFDAFRAMKDPAYMQKWTAKS